MFTKHNHSNHGPMASVVSTMQTNAKFIMQTVQYKIQLHALKIYELETPITTILIWEIIQALEYYGFKYIMLTAPNGWVTCLHPSPPFLCCVFKKDQFSQTPFPPPPTNPKRNITYHPWPRLSPSFHPFLCILSIRIIKQLLNFHPSKLNDNIGINTKVSCHLSKIPKRIQLLIISSPVISTQAKQTARLPFNSKHEAKGPKVSQAKAPPPRRLPTLSHPLLTTITLMFSSSTKHLTK